MSFTSTVKNEICTVSLDEANSISLLSALVKTIGSVNNNKITLTTENISVANKIFRLFKKSINI